MKFYFLDKLGWPIERVKGRPISNFIRLCLWTRRITTKRPKCLDPGPFDPNTRQGPKAEAKEDNRDD